MNIVVFGTGHVGGALVSELAGRGHEVTAVSRSGTSDLPARVAAVTGSVHDPAFLSSVTAGADAIVAALPALSREGSLGSAVTVLLQAVRQTGARLGVVGGAAIIPTVPGGPRQADTPDFPARFAPVVDAHQQALDILNSAPENVDWFYLVPAGEFGAHNPGSRSATSPRPSARRPQHGVGNAICLLLWDELINRRSRSPTTESTLRVTVTGSRPTLVIARYGRGVVGHAGARLGDCLALTLLPSGVRPSEACTHGSSNSRNDRMRGVY